MNKKNIYNLILLLLISINFFDTKGQDINYKQISENIVLFTDRNLYIVGEQINFSAFVFCGEKIQRTELSKVVYIELISPEGKKVSKGKFLIAKNMALGNLSIPRELVTGNYYLRAYTKFMRNIGPGAYSYEVLKIVNPYSNGSIATSDRNFMNTSTNIQHQISDFNSNFQVTLKKQEYGTREKVQISFNSFNDVKSIIGFCLTVVPKASISLNEMKPSIIEDSTNIFYYPETRGISLTGRLVNKTSGRGLPNKKINLTILGNEKIFLPDLTDSAGRFYFSLPDIYGERDIFLSAGKTDNIETSILVDNDFCGNRINLPFIKFYLSDDEKKVAYKFAVNQQVDSFFRIDTTSRSHTTTQNDKFFYGKPSEIIIIDEYIKLPTLAEYFTELPSAVRIKKKNEEKYFKIYSPIASMSVYEPLILVDGVAIDDTEKVLALNPQAIDRIEIINVPYVKGDLFYAGIISIVSKQGDLAGIDLPKSGIFFNYDFFGNNTLNDRPDTIALHQPDTRNSILWIGRVNGISDFDKSIYFTTSDTQGDYIVLLRGVTISGNIISKKVEFRVKN